MNTLKSILNYEIPEPFISIFMVVFAIAVGVGMHYAMWHILAPTVIHL